MEAQTAKADARVSAADAEVQAAEQALQKEQDLEDQGLVANVARRKRELEAAKKNQAAAVADQKKAAKEQQQINSALQAMNLISASTKIISTYAAAPYIWIPMLALMWGTYFYSLSKANAATAQAGVRMGKGGTKELSGGSHASRRNEIVLGNDGSGSPVIAEGGEKMSIFSRKASAKYGNRINRIVDQINSGKASPSTIDGILKMIETGNFESWVMGTNLDITPQQIGGGLRAEDLDNITGEVKRIRERAETTETTNSKGQRVIKYRNLTRTYV